MFGTNIFGKYQMFGNNFIFGTFVPYLYMQAEINGHGHEFGHEFMS